jgi:hypothetical protein
MMAPSGPLVDPQALAAPFVAAVRAEVAGLPPIRLVGLLATSDRGSQVYCDYTARGCEAVGIRFEQRWLDPEQVSATIFEANADPTVHGVMVYYPIFHGARDRSLQNEVAPEKDVEGLHASWSGRLYHDIRTIDPDGKKKAILPCTPLGIVKALEALEGLRRGQGPAPPGRGADDHRLQPQRGRRPAARRHAGPRRRARPELRHRGLRPLRGLEARPRPTSTGPRPSRRATWSSPASPRATSPPCAPPSSSPASPASTSPTRTTWPTTSPSGRGTCSCAWARSPWPCWPGTRSGCTATSTSA